MPWGDQFHNPLAKKKPSIGGNVNQEYHGLQLTYTKLSLLILANGRHIRAIVLGLWWFCLGKTGTWYIDHHPSRGHFTIWFPQHWCSSKIFILVMTLCPCPKGRLKGIYKVWILQTGTQRSNNRKRTLKLENNKSMN